MYGGWALRFGFLLPSHCFVLFFQDNIGESVVSMGLAAIPIPGRQLQGQTQVTGSANFLGCTWEVMCCAFSILALFSWGLMFVCARNRQTQ
mmetsp:Transcript_22080/g.50934  ORF Transcript_22080/g.50934 Transcript_22080/m.50934 type:complete len:91 (-) Transcript_22080:48-320(-)